MEGKELLDTLLKFIVENDASDLHISTGLEPRVRIHGEIITIESDGIGVIDRNKSEGMAKALLGDAGEYEQFLEDQ